MLKSAKALARRLAKTAMFVSAGLVLMIGATSGAWAQNCKFPAFGTGNVSAIGGSPAGILANVAANVVAANTAFLTQSTAFVGAPANPSPDQQGGGVWMRGVGGEVNIKTTSSTSVTFSSSQTPPTFPTETHNQPCNTQTHTNFDGIQVGADIAKLNVGGWNLHVGTTAGSLYTNSKVVGGTPIPISNCSPTPCADLTAQVPFETSTQAPFLGAYAAATKGGFFADVLVRRDFYQASLDSPQSNLYKQNVDAHGIGISGSAGYQYQMPNTNWFIEPSGSLVWSRVKVDPVNATGVTIPTTPFFTISGTTTINDITEKFGRLGLRVGTSIASDQVVWQPFAAVSVWHDFAGNTTASYSTCSNCLFFFGPAKLTEAYTGTNTGTFGQYSIGVTAQVVNTGWVGFARVDYRDGSRLEGWDGTAGLRYQFAPEALPARPMIAKAPIYKAPIAVAGPYNWEGAYVGGFLGASYGEADWEYPAVTDIPVTKSFLGDSEPKIGGLLGGGAVGYNHQVGPWVLGAEGDLAWSDAKGAKACGPIFASSGGAGLGQTSSPLFQETCNVGENWIATATAKLGYAWDRVLFYGKAGAAWTDEKLSATCNFGPINGLGNGFNGNQQCTSATVTTQISHGFTASDTRLGWTIGYGTEFAFSRAWSAKGEVDYADFGRKTLVASDGTVVNVGMHLLQAKVGINYHFATYPGTW
jgi:opacity protein-like surface antigen